MNSSAFKMVSQEWRLGPNLTGVFQVPCPLFHRALIGSFHTGNTDRGVNFVGSFSNNTVWTFQVQNTNAYEVVGNLHVACVPF